MTTAVLFGVGESARALAMYASEKGVRIVGAYSRTSGAGRDLGEHFGIQLPHDCTISTDPASELGRVQADVAMVATQSSLMSQYDIVKLCLEHRLDVLSLAEQGFYFSPEASEMANRIDELARASGRSVFFGGVQDVFWFDALLGLTGGAHRIDEIQGRTVSDICDLGPATIALLPLGLGQSEFGAYCAEKGKGSDNLGVIEPAVRAVLGGLGLETTRRTVSLEPVFADHDLPKVQGVDRGISAGSLCGISEIVTLETDQGVRVRCEFVSTVLGPGQDASVRWKLLGEPNLEVAFDHFPGYEVTASALVNRIPHVIAAEPGYRTVLDLPRPRWWAGVVKNRIDEIAARVLTVG